jgi:hypothetical protein
MMSSLIWVTFRVAALGALVYWLARVDCDFSTPQSIFLTALAVLSVEAHYLRHSAGKRFQPFSFWIKLSYRTLLSDAGLLSNEIEANEVEWAALIKATSNIAVPWDGTTCCVLSYNFDSGTRLIAWPESKGHHPPGTMPGWRDYSSSLTFGLGQFELESLPLARAYPAGRRTVSTLDAEFIVKPGTHGLQIVMRIDDVWWKARWTGSSTGKPSFSEHRDLFEYPDGPAGNLAHVELTVAVIPDAELQCLYDWSPTSAGVSLRRRRRATEAQGWTILDTPSGPGRCTFLSHKYAEVSHEPIE